jgi:hypothetical protein
VVERVLAQSPHSRVYLAQGPNAERAAVKELYFAQVPGTQEIDAFDREAQTLRALSHPSIPRFISSFSEGKGIALRFYLVFEYVTGQSLAQRIAMGGPLQEADIVRVARAVLDVLRALHGRSPAVLHRDIKPANIMCCEDGRIALVDFGSARTMEGARTHRSTLVGSFGYMPPEQLGGTVDRTSDLYALGATLLHAATGIAPSELLGPDLQLAVPSCGKAHLESWLRHAVALDPARRFQTADQALSELDRPRATAERLPRRPRNLVALIAVVATAIGLGAYSLTSRRIQASAMARPTPTLEARSAGNAALGWFERVKSRCNNLQARQVLSRDPPPPGVAGSGYGASCLALAGLYKEAAELIDRQPEGVRPEIAQIVFGLAHPVADNGDDVAAGPMMELVLRYAPDNYMALYHAGISHYANGQPELAKQRLTRFLELYDENDEFGMNARRVLQRIAAGQKP